MKLEVLERRDDGTTEACFKLSTGARVYVKETPEGLIIDVYPNGDTADTVFTTSMTHEEIGSDGDDGESFPWDTDEARAERERADH